MNDFEDGLIDIEYTLPLCYRLESVIDYFYDVENETLASELMVVVDMLDEHQYQDASNHYFNECHPWLEKSDSLQERRIAAYAKHIFLNLDSIIYATEEVNE